MEGNVMTNTDALLPCPHCDGEAVWGKRLKRKGSHYSDIAEFHVIECRNNACMYSAGAWHKKEQGVSFWNQHISRTPQPSVTSEDIVAVLQRQRFKNNVDIIAGRVATTMESDKQTAQAILTAFNLSRKE